MSSDLYREYLVELYRSPHNYGRLENPDVRQEGANPLCGDQVAIELRMDGDRVAEARFEGKGCAVSTAAASILTDLMPGKRVDEILAMTDEDMLHEMGFETLTPARLKCAILALKTTQQALGAGVGERERSPSGERKA